MMCGEVATRFSALRESNTDASFRLNNANLYGIWVRTTVHTAQDENDYATTDITSIIAQ